MPSLIEQVSQLSSQGEQHRPSAHSYLAGNTPEHYREETRYIGQDIFLGYGSEGRPVSIPHDVDAHVIFVGRGWQGYSLTNAVFRGMQLTDPDFPRYGALYVHGGISNPVTGSGFIKNRGLAMNLDGKESVVNAVNNLYDHGRTGGRMAPGVLCIDNVIETTTRHGDYHLVMRRLDELLSIKPSKLGVRIMAIAATTTAIPRAVRNHCIVISFSLESDVQGKAILGEPGMGDVRHRIAAMRLPNDSARPVAFSY